MNDTSLESVNAAKRAHAAAIIDKIGETVALIRSEPELWFGGLPPAFLQFENQVAFHIADLRTIFDLPVPEAPPAL